MTFETLKHLVIEWGVQKGILYSGSTAEKQAEKTQEELNELFNSLRTGQDPSDDYGDILVTLILGAALSGRDLTICLEQAYNVISKRTGKMVDGIFVKNE